MAHTKHGHGSHRRLQRLVHSVVNQVLERWRTDPHHLPNRMPNERALRQALLLFADEFLILVRHEPVPGIAPGMGRIAEKWWRRGVSGRLLYEVGSGLLAELPVQGPGRKPRAAGRGRVP